MQLGMNIILLEEIHLHFNFLPSLIPTCWP